MKYYVNLMKYKVIFIYFLAASKAEVLANEL